MNIRIISIIFVAALLLVFSGCSGIFKWMNVYPQSVNLTVGDSSQVLADSSHKSITWTSNNTNIVTVDKLGFIKAVKAGNATITGTSKGGVGSCHVYVSSSEIAPLSMSISATNTNLTIGSSTILHLTVFPPTASSRVQWTSSNQNVIVDGGGRVTAIKSGSTTITAKSAVNTQKATCYIVVQ